MAEITAAEVKSLREQTGVGMMECKKALQECDGDIQKAIDLLRERGAAKAVKRAGRATKEGRIQAITSDDKHIGAMVEVNIETDFAARNETFGELTDTVCKTALGCTCGSLDDLMKAKPAGAETETLEQHVADVQAVIGENMGVSRCVTMQVPDGKSGLIQTYIHPPGKVGVMVELVCENDDVAKADATAQLGRDLCLQVAFSNPLGLTSAEIDPAVIEREKEVYRNAAIQEGKPEKILDKIVDGRLKSFFKESCLLDQAFVKEEKQSISELIAAIGKEAGGKIELTRFERYELGGGQSDEA